MLREEHLEAAEEAQRGRTQRSVGAQLPARNPALEHLDEPIEVCRRDASSSNSASLVSK